MTKSKTPIAKSILSKRPKVVKNRIVIVLDASSSMADLQDHVRSAANAMIKQIKEQTKLEKQETVIAITKFADSVVVLQFPTDSSETGNVHNYYASGSTALFDAIGEAVEMIDTHDPDVSHLVLVYTDGENNRINKYTSLMVRNIIDKKTKLGNWTFAIQVPPKVGSKFSREFGIPLENIREWEATEKGVEGVRDTTRIGVASFMSARSRGAKSVDTFYVETDLSKLKTKDLKKELDNLQNNFRVLSVDREEEVRPFVESKTKNRYVIGSAYYELTKPELIQGNKNILIMERGKDAVWGGNEARDLVGLPTDGTNAKVVPLNHATYRIFTESRSVNRKLVRGTSLLVDKTKTRDAVPTWKA
jgi:hypothetical protein